MACVNKLINTQDAVDNDFKGDAYDDNRSRKRSCEVYAANPPKPTTFLQGDFDLVMDE